jgi:hypothetical protein
MLFGVAAFTFLAVSVSVAGECINAARLEYRSCKKDCREDYQIAKDACFNRDHACVESCREERAECRDATGFDADIDACNAKLDNDVNGPNGCKATYPPQSVSRDKCIDDAQVAAFQCRDQAREEHRPALRECRRAFRACARACGPAEIPVDARQCKLDAKTAFKACNAQCLEDRQLATDACRNKDHDCVEGCRTTREGCRAPILAQLQTDIDKCRADKRAAIDPPPPQCPPEGDPGRDSCVDDAQVIAFECRDQAREDARTGAKVPPGLNQCRANFRTCATGCPPPS